MPDPRLVQPRHAYCAFASSNVPGQFTLCGSGWMPHRCTVRTGFPAPITVPGPWFLIGYSSPGPSYKRWITVTEAKPGMVLLQLPMTLPATPPYITAARLDARDCIPIPVPSITRYTCTYLPVTFYSRVSYITCPIPHTSYMPCSSCRLKRKRPYKPLPCRRLHTVPHDGWLFPFGWVRALVGLVDD